MSRAWRIGILKPHLEALRWVGDEIGHLRLLDQRVLPQREQILVCRRVGDLVEAIRTLAVRGAPLIGVAAAYGVVLAARSRNFQRACDALVKSRPTAVNLVWAVRRVARASGGDAALALAEAKAIHREDALLCERIGRAGASLLGPRPRILTICNTGALATAGIGTAFAVFRHAIRPTVYALETRPRLQGARLTMFELSKARIRGFLLCDGAAGALMREGGIDNVVTGADRIAANGDTANKIGTYSLAVLAKENKIPFYVAAPYSTFDPRLAGGRGIPIERRGPEEVLEPLGLSGISALNPAFDVTPHEFIRAFITDRGILRPPYRASIARALGS